MRLRGLLTRAGLALIPAALAAVAVHSASTLSLRLEPGTAAWRRLVGTTPDGRLHDRAAVVLPGLSRSRTIEVGIEAESSIGGPCDLAVASDGGGAEWLRTQAQRPALLLIPPNPVRGLRIDLVAAARDAPVRIRSLTLRPAGSASAGMPLLAALLAGGLTLVIRRRAGERVGVALGLLLASLLGAASTPLLAVLTLPAPRSAVLVGLPLLLMLASLVLGLSRDTVTRRRYARGAGLLVALVLGAWARLYFLPSTGSWDTEYWKAWMLRAASHGVTRVYGDPDAVPSGHFVAQLRGKEELWRVNWAGRDFVVDYPPLAMAAWRASWWAVLRADAVGRRLLGPGGGLDHAEATSIAVKLPAVLGDMTAVALLLVALRDRPSLGLMLAALYWTLPISWLPSAVLGYLDGAYAPLLLASLVAAGRGRAGWAGTCLALAALVKPTAVVVAPAIAAALVISRASIPRACAAGLVVVGAALVPFAIEGTLATAVVHVYRILFQGTLSGGYANPWWAIGHALTAAANDGLAGPVRHARLDLVPFPGRSAGALLFAVAAANVLWRQLGRDAAGRTVTGARATCLAGAALVFAYGMLAVGVHENHPHPLFLLLFATGLSSRRLRWIAGVSSAAYVLNMLMLSGLGRFHGLRYSVLDPIVRVLAALRLAAGFDLTLLLVALNVVCFAALLLSLRGEKALSAEEQGGAPEVAIGAAAASRIDREAT